MSPSQSPRLAELDNPTKSVTHRNGAPLRSALPNDDHLPALLLESADVPAIPLDCTGKFVLPKLGMGLRIRREATVFVTVPKTAMDKNRNPMSD
jgi:hypothetical protein